jgi:hypothetical protein
VHVNQLASQTVKHRDKRTCPQGGVLQLGRTRDCGIDIRDRLLVTKDEGGACVNNYDVGAMIGNVFISID